MVSLDRIRPRPLAILILALLLAGSSMLPVGVPKAHAYSLWGYYWPNMSGVRYCNYASGNSATAFNNAVNAWNSSSAPVVYTQNCTNTDVELVSDNYGNTGWDGLTRVYATGSQTCNGWTQWTLVDTDMNTYYTDTSSYDNGARQSVATHEMGHAIGLQHSTALAVMIADTGTRWSSHHIDTPQSDDVNGVTAIYNKCY